MMMKRLAAAALSGAVLVGALAGCAQGGGGTDPTPVPTVSASAAPVETGDVVQKLVGIPRDADAFTVDGQSVLMEDYLYWMCYVLDNISYSVGGAENIVWDQDMGGMTFSEYVQQTARDMAAFYQTVRAKAAENNVALTEEEEAALDSGFASVVAQFGDDAGYARALQEVCQSDEGMRRLYATNALHAALQTVLFPTQEPAEGEVEAWCDEQGKMQVKHILIKTVGDDRQPLSAEEQEAAKAKAEDILAQLRASDDPETLFDTLMNENSEDGRDPDTGKLYAPDGYFFGPGEMVQEFEDASKALEVGGISDLVESSYGYHIILRLPIDMEEARPAWEQAQMSANQTKMEQQMTQWMEAAAVETGENYDAVAPQAFYEKLTALRDELAAADNGGDSGSAAPGDSAAPSAEPTPSGE